MISKPLHYTWYQIYEPNWILQLYQDNLSIIIYAIYSMSNLNFLRSSYTYLLFIHSNDVNFFQHNSLFNLYQTFWIKKKSYLTYQSFTGLNLTTHLVCCYNSVLIKAFLIWIIPEFPDYHNYRGIKWPNHTNK